MAGFLSQYDPSGAVVAFIRTPFIVSILLHPAVTTAAATNATRLIDRSIIRPSHFCKRFASNLIRSESHQRFNYERCFISHQAVAICERWRGRSVSSRRLG
jgi:hypothetical protein